MMNVCKQILMAGGLALLLVIAGLAQPSGVMVMNATSVVPVELQDRQKEKEKPVERPKDDKRDKPRDEEKRDDKPGKKKPY